jgi:hypothetical protein
VVGAAPPGVRLGGAVPEPKKSRLSISVHPFVLVYGSCIRAILFFTFFVQAMPLQKFFFHSLSE